MPSALPPLSPPTFAEPARRHRQTAAERRAESFAECTRRRKHEEQLRRDFVIAEFNGDILAMADEILRYRHGLNQVTDALEWIRQGAPFVTLVSGPYWQPKPAPGNPGEPSPDPGLTKAEAALAAAYEQYRRDISERCRTPAKAWMTPPSGVTVCKRRWENCGSALNK
jgi:hypothetical protein